MLDNLIKYDFRQQFFDLSQPKMIRDIMANLEAKNSKLFFEIVQKVSGLKKQATIAKAFKQDVDKDGIVKPASTFAQHISSLYHSDIAQDLMPDISALGSDSIDVTDEDIKQAFKKLKTGKAIGVDILPDKLLKAQAANEQVFIKIKAQFRSWLNGEPLPKYMKQSKTIILSKEDGNQYPKNGNIRTLAVSCCTTKLYEHVILAKL